MACQVEQIADCGDVATLARALFISDKEDNSWLSQCSVSLSSCGYLLAVAYRNRLCLLTSQWISATDSNTYLISWSGTVPANVTAVAAFPICPSQQSSQNGADWFCIIVGYQNGSVGFYTHTGHLLLSEKLDEKPVMTISCHTGTYGTLPDDIYILFPNCECIITGNSLFQTLRFAKAQLARVQAGLQTDYAVDGRNIQIRKWSFSDQDVINDAGVVGLELKNTYDHLLAASTYGGYDTWYRSIPPANTLILGAGGRPYVGFHYALEGGSAPPLQDVARAVANRIKSALPGWLGGGPEREPTNAEPRVRSEPLSMRSGLSDAQRVGVHIAVSPDRRLAAIADNTGRVALLDVNRGHLVRMFKGYRDAQCGFVQVFEESAKKPQLSTIKETRRAVFLIIYNPKKGLIDIRLMQTGARVAVFTATKNGKLLYNTSGLVGAEPSYTHKRLNLPQHQCVLIDPDGKLKTFNIPFFFALEGEHSARSKDLHLLRDLRECLKKSPNPDSEREEIINKARELKMLDLKKHFLEMLIRNYKVSPEIVMACVDIFWDSLADAKLDEQSENIKTYFRNLVLITLFYRRINNENTDDMQELVKKVLDEETSEEPESSMEESEDAVETSEDASESEAEEAEEAGGLQLLEDDGCVLERLLLLAQERDYRARQPARVSFADAATAHYKDFVTSFALDHRAAALALRPDASPDKLNNLAAYVYKSIFQLEDLSKLTEFVKESRMDPQELVRLLIVHVTSMSLEELSVGLAERLAGAVRGAARAGAGGGRVRYSEQAAWGGAARAALAAARCPLRALAAALACKAAARALEPAAAADWESLTTEAAQWGLLIGKLEDISILSIVLMLKRTFNGKTLPKLDGVDFDVNLKYVYSRGQGSVTELISKWLCSLGVPPAAVVANALMDRAVDPETTQDDADDRSAMFLEDHRQLVDDNPTIFKWVSLLRQQFPFSTSPDYIVANMSWEYALAWQRSTQDAGKLAAVVDCLTHISDQHLQLGLCSIIWTTYVKDVFESSCRLVNKVGKLPKERLCVQDVALSDDNMVKFLEVATTYLEHFLKWSSVTLDKEKRRVQYEKIWEDNNPSLVEVAQNTHRADADIVSLNYQVACTIYYMCHFKLKVTKPLNNLYDIDYDYIFEAIAGKGERRELNMKPSDKLKSPRMKYLNKLIRAALELVSCQDAGPSPRYDTMESLQWMDKVHDLAHLWHIDDDFVKRQQLVGTYHLGYDQLAEELVGQVKALDLALQPLLAITAQRLKRHLELAADPAEWLAAMPPHLVVHLNNYELDPSVPAHASPASTISVLQRVLEKLDNCPLNTQNIKLAALMVRGCETIIEMKL
ncbi:rab3 GTPase-activating protein regulatory subunit [Plutella xylostella]|uniref:rab3 GTPase-activating protein regulatory subunit n=1 Tax=Plutella xylostella TaxID=51655 RepID=UPI0020326E2B|nr:rab3 GTPase-activating protein regulatory subunit [Plutella xylostella]